MVLSSIREVLVVYEMFQGRKVLQFYENSKSLTRDIHTYKNKKCLCGTQPCNMKASHIAFGEYATMKLSYMVVKS